MPFYEYECSTCGFELSDFQKMSEFKRKTKCPQCKKSTLVYQYGVIYGSVKQEPSTVQHLAARNTEKMGSIEYQDKLAEAIKSNPSLDPKKRSEVEKTRKINRMNEKQKTDYIETGILY